MPAVSPNVSNPISNVALNSSNSLINAMLGGAKWGGVSTGPNQTQQTTIYFSFPTATDSSFWSQSDAFGYGYSGDETEGFTTFNSTQIAAATSALQQWANVANINFELVNETTSAVGDIRFGNTTAGAMQPNNYAYTWSLSNISLGVASPDSGDIWLNTFQPVSSGNDYSVGAVGYHTILHEIGHALGVDHTFAEGAGDLGVPVQYDTYQYSVMSYSDKAGSLDDGFSGYYPTTPMLLDIQAIQYLYGANMSYNAGNNVYVFEQNATYYQTIWDGGGNDTIQFNSDSNFPTITTTINLNAGSFSQLGRLFTIGQPYPGGSYDAQGNNVAIAYGAIIENATGGSGSDTLIGNAVSNVLRGGAGNDTINGGAGDDLIFGDADADFMVGGDGSDIYYVDDIADKTIETNAAVAGGIDRVQSTVTYTLSNYIEELFLQGADNINATGNASNNIIRGTTGNNILDGGAGADDLRGGFGDDTYIVDNAGDQIYDDSGNDTVIVKLASGTFALANYIAANSVENVILFGNASINAGGDNGNNVMTGNDGANILDGKAGADAMNGGKGADTYLVNSSGDTVTENFTLALGGGIDLVKSEVDFVLGANLDNLTLMGADSINGTGNALANIIIGNAGNNQMSGGAANDTLTGNAGNDSLNGDEGNDILQGGDNDDTLTGGAGVDALTGGKGNDTYYIDITRNTALATATLALQDTVSELANPLNSTVEGIDTIILTNTSGNSGVLGSAGAPIDASNLTNVTTLTVNANLENFDARDRKSVV